MYVRACVFVFAKSKRYGKFGEKGNLESSMCFLSARVFTIHPPGVHSSARPEAKPDLDIPYLRLLCLC